MKKFLVGLLTVALAASMLVGCGKKEEKKKADNSLKDVQSKKELILGLDASFPPMGFTDKKQNIVGFDIDLAKEVTKRMGIKLKLQPINWDSKEQELDTGKIDCIWNGLTVSPDRKKVMLCSESYMDNHQVLVVPAKSKIKSLKDVKKQTVGVQKGSTAADAVDSTKELKDADYSEIGHNPNCGDEISIELKLNGDIIEDMAFTGHGCAISQASTSIMIDTLKGKTIEQAKEIIKTFIEMIKRETTDEQELKKLEDAIAFKNVSHMPARVKCALLAWHTIEDILNKKENEEK